MATLTQDNRPGSLMTPLGKDKLALVRFNGTEALSEMFEFHVEAISEEKDINFDAIMGRQCTVKLKTFGGERIFNGILVAAQWLGPMQQEYYGYRLVLRPWLWLLSRTSDCRIFQDKKAPDILKEVFSDRGFTDFESKLSEEGSFPKLDYCVQYRETDLNFVTRLMEKEGIYYYFRHEDGKHTLVLANAKSSHKAVPGHANTTFNPVPGEFTRKEELLNDWASARELRSGKFELNDYNYEDPNTQLISDANASESYQHANMEIYRYPGNYTKQSVGERYAKIELQAEQAHDHRCRGTGTAASLFPGGLTTLKKHPIDSQNIEYLIVQCTHSYGTQIYGTAGTMVAEDYNGSYQFRPSDRPFRAPIVTPKPLIHGIQTAKVVTKDEGGTEEIDVEKLSEIYVQFYWDRKKHKEKRSCKLRCAQVWSGKNWGGQFIPRVGMEAVVEFLDGDPDRPLVVGTVYNDEYKPPFDLPSKKNIAGIFTNSTKGGGGKNELHFDDTAKSEKIRMHGEKDHEVVIRHAETTDIGETFEIPVGSPSRDTKIQKGDDHLDIQSGDQNIKIAMNQKTETGMTIKTSAGLQIEVFVGDSKITINPVMIKLEATLIQIKAQAMLQLEAGALTTLKGGIVMIN